MSIIDTIESIIRHGRQDAESAVAEVKAEALAEERKIAADVVKAITEERAKIRGEAPGIAAEVSAYLDRIVKAAVDALSSHGL